MTAICDNVAQNLRSRQTCLVSDLMASSLRLLKFLSLSRLADRRGAGSFARATSRRPREGLLQPGHRQSTGTPLQESAHELHQLLSDRSGSELGGESLAARRALRRHVRRPRDAVRPQTSLSFNVPAVLVIVDFNRVR